MGIALVGSLDWAAGELEAGKVVRWTLGAQSYVFDGQVVRELHTDCENAYSMSVWIVKMYFEGRKCDWESSDA